jgi:AraC family transcriptional activator of pobA
MQQLFHIFRILEEDALRISAAPDEPHQHDYEELIVGMEGMLDHFIDFKTTLFEAPLISFVAKGKMHRVIPGLVNGKCQMWVIRFQSEFIPETTFQLYSYYHDHANIKLQDGLCYDRMIQLCTMMYEETELPVPDLGIISHLLIALFSMIESERKKSTPGNEDLNKTQNITFKNFLKILEENFRRPAGVNFYAEKLFMSARNLNLVCKNILNQSVSEIIETRKLIEAKNLLINTDKTVSEIGYELGYKEKAYFTNVFKKKSGQPPSAFRKDMRRHIS